MKSRSLWVLAIASVLRLILSVVNRDANDDHFEVVRLILSGVNIDETSCWQCYQPKLYYTLWSLGSSFFSLRSHETMVVFGQIINFIAGTLTLFVIYKFFYGLKINKNISDLGYALIAFNPALLSINVQATNDTLLIMFSTLAIYFLALFFSRRKYIDIIAVTLFTCLAALTKGSGIILFAGIVFIILVRSVSSFVQKADNKMFFIGFLIILTTVFGTVTKLGSPYWKYYANYKNPLITNLRAQAKPEMIKDTYIYRPGITSVVRGYLSFYFTDLIKHPYQDQGVTGFPLHRISFLTTLYGNYHSLHFASWPKSWKDYSWFTMNVTRALMIIGIIPTLVFLIGIITIVKYLFNNPGRIVGRNKYWLDFTLLTFLSLFFVATAIYSYIYRDYSTMKPLFLFPVIIVFPVIFARGLMTINKIKNKIILKFVYGNFLVLLYFYLLDSILLIGKLI